MRHMLVVGFIYGETIGKIYEAYQWLHNEASGWNAQDFYSNRLGANFAFLYAFQILIYPNNFSNYLQHFFSEPKGYNHKYRGSIWF